MSVVRSSYNIQMDGTPYNGAPETCNLLGPNNSAQAYRAGADPIDPAIPRYFAVNALSVVYEDTASLYAAMPESAPPVAGHPVH